MVDSILLHNVENSCLSDSSSVHGHTNTHNTHERRSSLRETAFTFQTSSTQNPNLRHQEENRKTEKKKKKRLVTDRDRQRCRETGDTDKERQAESTLPIRSSKPCTSLGLAVTMTDSLSMFRISVFLCNILGWPAAAVAISQTQTKKMVCLCPIVCDVVKEMLAIWAFPPTVDYYYYLLLLLLLLLLPLTHFTRCYLRCTHLSGDDWVILDYCIDCGHDERERFRTMIPRCRTYAKKSANKRQEREEEDLNWWIDELPSILQSPSDILWSSPHRNTRDSLADLWITITICCSVDSNSPFLYALWVWCLISWFSFVFPLSSSPSFLPGLGARARA